MHKDRMRHGRNRQRRARVTLFAALLLLLALAPALAHAQGAGADTVVLVWTAPGDDGTVGTASSYELRVSQSLINDANWASALVVPGTPAPQRSGSRERFVVRGLTRGTTYYFAIKSTDDASNQSNLSNVVRWDWVYDTAPPAAPSGVSAAREGSDVRVHWSPNSESDLAGYTVYRALAASGPFTPLNSPPMAPTEFLDNTLPAGTDMVWYQVTASDLSGNESARSSVFGLSLTTQVSAWKLEPVYPNPSQLSVPVSIPLAVPSSGTQGAAVDIVDAAGHLVRRIDVSNLGAGPQTVIWDGRNEAGRELAPGVYTVWLIAGGDRSSVKLVRVP